ncbi:hypothetical protein [Raineyella sp. W15-4]|uniref:hypothetical protein n=1 Tax=Raineyella sp. W15-4 TaxID=3081651 RepID=UPI002953642B|nr:hypothetical protein [Raineyella sp. W15-4]WOQ17629.1 hypothetical protein R0145_02640 [Raineyella sp. W15-4]
MDSWFETFCQELVIRRSLERTGQALVLAREDFGVVLQVAADWSVVPAAALAEGLGPRWVGLVRAAVMPLVEADPATGTEWQPGAAAGYRARPDAVEGVVTDVLVVDLTDTARGSGQWVLPYRADDSGVSFAAAVRAGECADGVLALGALDPRDPGRIPAPDGSGLLSRARARLTLDLGGAQLGVQRAVDADGDGFAYATEPYATQLREAGIDPVELVTLDL